MSISPDPGGLIRSPLEYPINAVIPIRIFLFRRDPENDKDFKNFRIRDMWINSINNDVWMLTSKNRTSGTWTQLSSGGPGGILSLTGDSGGAVFSDSSGDVKLLGGTDISVTGDPGANTLTFSSTAPPPSTFTWFTDAGPGPINVSAEEGRLANGGASITYNLPATCTVGDIFIFVDLSGNGFVVKAAAGDQIRRGSQITSAGGTIASSAVGDALEIVCAVTDTTFFALDSIGNFIVT